jgi:hypothetical protein
MFDYNHSNLPVTYQNLWRRNFLTRNADNDMALHNDNDFYIPLCRLESYKIFSLYELPRLWNEFDDDDIKHLCSRSLFKKSIKSYYLEKLASNVSCQ